MIDDDAQQSIAQHLGARGVTALRLGCSDTQLPRGMTHMARCPRTRRK